MSRSDRWLTLVLIALTAANLYLSVNTAWTRGTYRDLIRQQTASSSGNGRKLDALLFRFGVPDPTTQPATAHAPRTAR